METKEFKEFREELTKKQRELLTKIENLQKDFSKSVKQFNEFKKEYDKHMEDYTQFKQNTNERLGEIEKTTNKKFEKEYLGNAEEKTNQNDKTKNYLSVSISYDKLKQLKGNEKGTKYLSITELKEPDTYNNTHSVHNRIKGDKYSKINLCFSKENLDKMHVIKDEKSGKQFVNFYVAEISPEKKAEKNINADYSIYQYDKESKETNFIGAGFDAEKQRNNEQHAKKEQSNEQER